MKILFKLIFVPVLVIALVLGGFTLANEINKTLMNEYIDSFATVEKENQLTPEIDADGNYYFVSNGDFKVLHLTDVHICGGILSVEKDKKAINAVAAMITEEKPDLVIVTGDVSFAVPWSGTINNAYAHEYFKRLMENLGVYWTITFGNHDSESYNFHDRKDVAKMYEDENLKYCLYSSEDGGVYGESNHVINLRNSAGLITKSFIMMDTNSYTEDDPIGIFWKYENIHADQIEWYESKIQSFNDYNASVLEQMDEKPENIEDFTTVKSMIFVHIPLMEVRTAYLEYLAAGEKDTGDLTYIEGEIGEEAPYVYCSNLEEEMFETMLELGSTEAMFYGHDHLNNLVIDYKGIILSYGYSIDYFAYSDIDKIGSQRGCTVINCSGDTSFEIIHENYYQDKYKPLYEKEIVED